jgi:hypothetical protein
MEKLNNQDLVNATRELKEKFEIDKSTAINLIGTNIVDYPELIKFLGNESYDVMMQKGIVSLRTGFYKIIEKPYEKDYGRGITTFAAKVLYFENTGDKCIQYNANIGPMVNASGRYALLGGDGRQDKLMTAFLSDRVNDNSQNFSDSKEKFFNSVFKDDKIFWIQSAEFSKLYPKTKEIVWSFFN